MTARIALPLLLTSLLGAACYDPSYCAEEAGLAAASDVLIIGDSILAWSKGACASPADNLANARGAAVLNAAVNGAQLSGSTIGITPIPEQYVAGDWTTVVLNGGINDLNNGCACGACSPDIDELVSEDGTTGEMPALVDELTGRGHQAVLVGYYALPDTAAWGFAECNEKIGELNERYQVLAETRANVTFVDPRGTFDPAQTPALYDSDNLHPSPAGAEALGELIAEQL